MRFGLIGLVASADDASRTKEAQNAKESMISRGNEPAGPGGRLAESRSVFCARAGTFAGICHPFSKIELVTGLAKLRTLHNN